MKSIVLAALQMVLVSSVAAQRPDEQAMKAEQRAKLTPFVWMDGVWRGDATVTTPKGPMKLTQTERVGPMLDASARVIEGRGYDMDGKLVFNALAVIAWNPAKKAYEIHAFSDGRIGVFGIAPNADGYTWETPAGPGLMRYVATFHDGVWHETGEFTMSGMPPRTVIDMRLKRIGGTDWPLTKPVAPK